MLLSHLYSIGAYIVAGHLDISHGDKVVRLGDVSATGEVTLTPDGEAFVGARSGSWSTLPAQEPKPEVVPRRAVRKPAAKAAEPAAPVVELGTGLSILDAVDE